MALSYVPFVYLVYIYAGHGIVEGLIEREEFAEIIGGLGFGTLVTTLLVFGTGLLDTFVAILLVAREKIWPQLPVLWLYLWVGLWPWVPRLVEMIGGLEPEFEDAIVLSIVAAVAYVIDVRYHKKTA